MSDLVFPDATSVIKHVFIPDPAYADGRGKTGLAYNTSGLKIVVIRPGDSAFTKYLQSASNIETITTIGTYATPTSGKCRFKEIDSTDAPGWYELQFADALFSNGKRLLSGTISLDGTICPTPFAVNTLNLPSDVKQIDGSSTAAAALKAMGLACTTGTVQTDAGNSTTQFKTNLSSSTNDYYGNSTTGGNVVVFTSGNLVGQCSRINGYNGTSKIVSVVDAFTGTPSNGDTFVILGRIEM